MEHDSAHQKNWQIFEVIVGIPFLAAIGLQLVWPIAFPFQRLKLMMILLGCVLVFAGLLLVTIARREFARQAQPTDPGFSTSRIIKTGVFSYSRNPLYLGGILFLLGINLGFRITWGVILLIPALVACRIMLVGPEEKYLATKFGEDYLMYKARVHRWIGRK
ncbi:isoprenylcysteine carboxylmethyltransferase family protein [bacterium]|nr:isoprenylcysteine carboxylmethyltransferase family protein [bacterium]